MGGDILLGKRIMADISLLEKKDLENISSEKNSDLTFFNINEQETDDTIRMLKQNYVTHTYKDETILNLQNELNKEDNTSIDTKIKSYELYNEALDLLEQRSITDATLKIKSASELNPKDTDILNLKGLLGILNCNFKEALECFYTSMCYKTDPLPKEYVETLSSDKFNEFLARYNHCIRFINEELNQESIQILNNIIEENPEFIEPYVILTLLYKKLDNKRKSDYYLQKLKLADKSNKLLKEQTEEVEVKKPKKSFDKKNFVMYSAVLIAVSSGLVYHFNNKAKIDELNEAIKLQEEKLDETGKLALETEEQYKNQIKEKEEELSKKEDEIKKIDEELSSTKEKLDQKEEELKKVKEEQQQTESVESTESDEVSDFNNAVKLKNVENYTEAIKYFKKVVENGKSKKYIAESIYQVAYLSEKTNNYEDAKKYYQKYINTYTKNDVYYDDCFYNLGLIYYEEGSLQKAKDIFYGLRYEVPDSEFNNSKVKEILSE